MNTVIIIDKQCNITEKKTTIDNEAIYKLGNFRNRNHFDMRHTWKVDVENKVFHVSVYSKDHGNYNQENKYDLPPPIDHDLYFGKLIIIAKDEKHNYTDLSVDLWKTIYEKLFGGFEDLSKTAEEDENESDELDEYSDSELTSSGYLKDGFVVDDHELDYEDYVEEN